MMDKDWTVKFYSSADGLCPINEFLETLSEKDRKKVDASITYLDLQGANLRRPRSDYLTNGIHELRIKLSRGETRTLYFFCFETYIVLTHAFYKRTDAVPVSEINKALEYKNDILNRYNKDNIQEL